MFLNNNLNYNILFSKYDFMGLNHLPDDMAREYCAPSGLHHPETL